MTRGDVLLVTLPQSERREEKGTRPAIAVQTELGNSPMLMVVPRSRLRYKHRGFDLQLGLNPL